MYAQNCSYLPNKKQSEFNNSSFSHNIGLLRNFSSQSFSKFGSSIHSSINIQPCKYLNINQHTSRTKSIMDFVYTFGENSRVKMKESLSNKAINLAPDKSRNNNCKQLISHYNTVPQMEFLSSHLVGGFVGSKSQLGRSPAHGFGVNMWDIIRELIGAFGHSSANILEKGSLRKHSLIEKKYQSTEKLNSIAVPVTPTSNNHNTNTNIINMPNKKIKLKEALSSPTEKQSYADVAKIQLEPPLMKEMSSTAVTHQVNSQMECSSALEQLSVCGESVNRSRITSESSIDSEDSFIVFECEGDDISVDDDDDDYSTSDDDSVMEFEIVFKDSCSDHDDTFVSTKDDSPPRKKVQFAEGKNLTEVHSMVTWDYAYRAARKGPWEMLARDSARFKHRIAKTEAILLPVLDPAHREAIYQQRFSETGTLQA